jgi:hypothetical protein
VIGRSPTIAGVPWRVYRDALRFGLRSMLASARGRRDYAPYLSWRFVLGAIRGHRERRLERRHDVPRPAGA